jgi:hypothetical protein
VEWEEDGKGGVRGRGRWLHSYGSKEKPMRCEYVITIIMFELTSE